MNKLNLPIAELLGAETGKTKSFPISAKIPSPDLKKIKIISPVQGQVLFEKLPKSILGKFDLKTELEFLCVRCLKKFTKKINLSYSQEFKTKTKVTSENTDYQLTIENGKLNILSSIQQEILLHLSIQILCNQKCKGLCSKCGQDQNLKTCSCPKRKIAKPLTNLKKIIKSGKPYDKSSKHK